MFLSEPCKQCGLRFHTRNGCGAKHAACNKCGQIGHFGRTCLRADRSSRKEELDVQRKKLRDRRRMTEFMTRKDAMNLPFYSLTDSELDDLSFNSALRRRGPSSTKRRIRYLEGRISGQDKFVQFYKSQYEEMELQLQDVYTSLDRVEEEKEKLLTEFHAVNKDLDIAKGQKKGITLSYHQERKRRTALQTEIEQFKDIKCNNDKLKQEIKSLEETLAKTENKTKEKDDAILHLTNELSIAEGNGRNLRNHCANKDMVLNVIRTETENRSSVSDDQDSQMCEKCGSHDRVHSRNRCPAKRYLCHVCKKWGHFPIFCTLEKHPIDSNFPMTSRLIYCIKSV